MEKMNRGKFFWIAEKVGSHCCAIMQLHIRTGQNEKSLSIPIQKPCSELCHQADIQQCVCTCVPVRIKFRNSMCQKRCSCACARQIESIILLCWWAVCQRSCERTSICSFPLINLFISFASFNLNLYTVNGKSVLRAENEFAWWSSIQII